MADYTPLLTRAVTGQDEAARAGIYARARDALERQLRGFEPKLEEAQIQAEIEGLEKAIATVEAVARETSAKEAKAEETPAGRQVTAAPVTAEPAAATPTPAAVPEQEAAPAIAAEAAPVPQSVPERQDTPATEPALPEEAPPVAQETPASQHSPGEAEVAASTQEASAATPLDEAVVLKRDSTSDFAAPPLVEPVIPPVARPRMPLRNEARASRKPLIVGGIAALAIMLAVGGIALTRRGTPDPLRNPQTSQQQASASAVEASKTEGRLASEPARPAEPPAQQPPAQQPPKASTPTAPEAPLSTSSRAFLVMETPGNAPSQFEGAAIWSFEPDPANKGQKALRTLIAFPGADMTVDMTMSRNTSPGIAASHLMMAIFETPKGAEPIREMSPLEWRERESTQGSVLRGSVVPVQDNIFMVTLDKAAEGANLDLILRQKWIVFEFRLANGRRGAALVEKGASGDRAVAEAITGWK